MANPRATLLGCAVALELIALVLWPTLYYGNGPEQASGFQGMFAQRYPFVMPLVTGMRAVVDFLFPSALAQWENLIFFLAQCFVALFVVYALAACRVTPPVHGTAEERAEASRRLRTIGLGWVLVPLLFLQTTLVFIPSTMTTDLYNYAIYGEMPVLYGANPFVHTPQEYPESPLYYLIPVYWHDAPSVYGPFWVDISVAVASVMRSFSLADELLTYRIIANVAHFVNTWLVWLIARRLRPDTATSAAIAYGWNPLLLVDFSFNGHNDVLMLTLTLLSLWLACRRQHLTSSLALGLSVATKYTSILIAPLLLLWGSRQPAPLTRDELDAGEHRDDAGRAALDGARQPPHPSSAPPVGARSGFGASERPLSQWAGLSWRDISHRGGLGVVWRALWGEVARTLRGLHVGRLILLSAVILATVVVLYIPWIEGPSTFGPVLYWMTGPRSNNFWPDGMISTITTTLWLINGGDWSETWNAVLGVVKLLAKIGLVVYLVIELLRIRAFTDVLAASARIFLFFLLLVNTWVMPWYFTWPLALSAALGWGERLVRVCAGFTMTAMILMYQRQWTQTLVEERGGVFLVLPIILVLLPDAARLARHVLFRPTKHAPARMGRSSSASS